MSSGVVAKETSQFFGLIRDDKVDGGGSKLHCKVEWRNESKTSLALLIVSNVMKTIPTGCFKDFSFSSRKSLVSLSTCSSYNSLAGRIETTLHLIANNQIKIRFRLLCWLNGEKKFYVRQNIFHSKISSFPMASRRQTDKNWSWAVCFFSGETCDFCLFYETRNDFQPWKIIYGSLLTREKYPCQLAANGNYFASYPGCSSWQEILQICLQKTWSAQKMLLVTRT